MQPYPLLSQTSFYMLTNSPISAVLHASTQHSYAFNFLFCLNTLLQFNMFCYAPFSRLMRDLIEPPARKSEDQANSNSNENNAIKKNKEDENE